MKNLNISIVLFKNNPDLIKRVIYSSLLSNIIHKLFLINNSPTEELSTLLSFDSRIKHIFNNSNLGYGKAHNIAIKKSIEEQIPYHLVLNPDIYFENNVIEKLYKFMENNPDVGLIMPNVLYPDGKVQHLCKLLPTPFDLIGRRFLAPTPLKKYVEKKNEIYELRFTGYDKIMNVPCLSGCFMFFRVEALKNIGLFDERFFMYLEDTDLSRRMHAKYKTLFYPDVNIYHEYEKASYKDLRSLKRHTISAIKYFNKWGWFFDQERKRINQKALNNIKAKESK
jgi:hypothetical protein